MNLKLFLFAFLAILAAGNALSQELSYTAAYTDGNRNAPTLYIGRMNTLEVHLYAIKNDTIQTELKEITLTATPATVKSLGNNKFGIMPSDNKLTINLYYKGKLMESSPFDVRQPPKPRFVVRDAQGGKPIDTKNGVKGAGMFRVSVEEGKHEDAPKDNPYKIQGGQVILVRGTQQVAKIALSNELADTMPWASLMKPGDRIVISVSGVMRTIEGKREKVEVEGKVISVPVL